ncbi:uncharacterized protein LOC130613316 [Hydractinia symbiolongicarpus]|uniref:uncharacterized protein LOC130613316 n=1 Tax=Hydractinia symbiolongicarpus TaxID=13093 RepID=UPI00254F346C|nr:uncharacterized protein LOC130613316 [Hydractinia symbiolongicarpus]
MDFNDIQLQRSKNGSLPHLSNWSRHEPASIKRSDLGNTDHWAKTKHKNVTLFTTGVDKKTHFYPGERYPHEVPPKTASTFITPHFQVDGKMKHIGTITFTDLLLKELNGNWPGDYQKTRIVNPHNIRTNANRRARDGLEYWYKDPITLKPKASKSWIGNGGSIIGTSQK